MKILIIGGTRFLGRHLVNAARVRRHEVTLFNRGKTNPDLFRKVKTISGDRETDLNQLSGKWDAVIDTCGYFPRIVNLSAQALKDKIEKYVFISSVSVYESFAKIGINESDQVAKLQDESIEEITGETYGALKALCEKTVQDVYGLDSLIIRPGLIVGAHDPTDRFTYWVKRVAQGGEILAPESPNALTQIIDVRDLADFILDLIENDVSGVFNATGPDTPLSFGMLLDTCKLISSSDAKFKWANVDFLEKNNVAPWSDLPAWLPSTVEDAGFMHVDFSKAVKAGLKFSALEDTVKNILEWINEFPSDYEMKAGLSKDRELELLRLLSED
jgi:2'-hydroxyisoflavone reductase